MKKTAILFSCLLLTSMAATAQEKPTTASYTVNFDRSAVRTRTDRVLNSLTLGGNTVSVQNPSLMYHDLTQQHFTARPGQVVTPFFGYSGQWMQGYVYIDLDNNGRFDVGRPATHDRLEEAGEMMAFAGMTLDDGLYNSASQQLTNLAAVQPPSFTIPADLPEGYYMMRWKVDWDDCDPAGRMTTTNDIITNGGAIADVLLLVTNEPDEGAYQLVFADEFDLPDGSRPDPAHWRVSTRRHGVWNRWISDSPEVAFIEDGNLVCRAIPNADTAADDIPMLTGSVETQDLFSFTYGKVEVRLRTNPYQGNFPAAWMMPQPPCETWPNAGEIDIFEAIDAQNTSYHTIHSHWSYDLGQKNNPKSSFTKNVNVEEWHTYGMEWQEDSLTFTVDGQTVGIYPRSTDEAVLAQGQWPFTHPFYIILNQSVGNGSWAKEADTNHVYETRFDYVRVYQKAGTDGIQPIVADSPAARRAPQSGWYDLFGRAVSPSRLKRGIYLHDGRKKCLSKI